MKLTIAFLFSLVIGAAHAACPGGSTCQTYNGQYNYTINGGTTARNDYNRWQDNWKSFADIGVDCTGNTDSSTALQTAINAMSANQSLVAPLGCRILLGTGITFTNAVGPQLLSMARVENNNSGAPTFIWNGTGGTMFTYSSVDHPTIRGFSFIIASGKSLNKFLSFDGAGGGGTISTIGRIEQNSFDSTNQNTNSFVAVEVSLTSGSNNENFIFQDNTIFCSGSNAVLRSVAGSVSSGSPNLTGATGANFVSGDVGKRIRVSYAGGILDTTISSITSGTAVVMAANSTFSQSGVSVNVGEAYGIGFHNGSSANAKHQKLYRNTFTKCATAIYFENGSFDINFFGGGWNDVGVAIGGMSESSSIGNYVTEHDVRFLSTSNGLPITVWNARYVTDNAEADGFILSNGGTNLVLMAGDSQNTLPSNASFLRFTGGGTTNVTAIANSWQNNTYAQVGYASAGVLTVLNDTGVDTNFSGTTRFLGLPTSCSGLATGTLRSNAGVATICP